MPGWSSAHPSEFKEECRDATRGKAPARIAADMRSAWREARRDRGLSATILATITLAIGVTATVFAVFNAVVLYPVPYRDLDRLVMALGHQRATRRRPRAGAKDL